MYVAFGVMFTSAGVFAAATARAFLMARRPGDAALFALGVLTCVYLAAHTFLAGLPIA